MQTNFAWPVSLQAEQKTKSRVTTWFKTENFLFSSLLEESVTNLRMLLMVQAMLAFNALVLVAQFNLVAAALCLAWFATSLLLCKKGGLK